MTAVFTIFKSYFNENERDYQAITEQHEIAISSLTIS
jgi:hypothetical protein